MGNCYKLIKTLTDFCMMPAAVSLAAVTRVSAVRIFQMATKVASILWRVVNPQVGQSHACKGNQINYSK